MDKLIQESFYNELEKISKLNRRDLMMIGHTAAGASGIAAFFHAKKALERKKRLEQSYV